MAGEAPSINFDDSCTILFYALRSRYPVLLLSVLLPFVHVVDSTFEHIASWGKAL